MLTSNGAGNPPSWSSGPGPALILISSTTTTSGQSTVNITSGITTAYNTYYVLVTNVGNSSGQSFISLNYSTNGGSSYVSTGYQNTCVRFQYNSATVNAASLFTVACQLSVNSIETSSSCQGSAWAYLYNVTNGNGTTSIGMGSAGTPTNPNQNMSFLACNFGNASAINALSFGVGGPGSGQTMPAGAVFSLFGVVE
jgi:hypothetical protein